MRRIATLTIVAAASVEMAQPFSSPGPLSPTTTRMARPFNADNKKLSAERSLLVPRRRISSKLHSSQDKKDRGLNLLEPGKFPTIEIEEPPQDEIYQQAIQRTLLWVGLAVAFGSGLGVVVGPDTAEEFFAGYLVEQSLSVDNLFVFLLLFEYFQVPLRSQDRVLNWGIYGAIVMRAVMIGAGAAALKEFRAILLVFAGILVYSSAKTLIPGEEDEEEEDLNDNAIVKFSRKLFDSTDQFDGSNFFTVVDGVKMATPLFICMIALEISDVVFAVDSIPAVFGVTEVSFANNLARLIDRILFGN